MKNSTKILVTGADGMLGSHICRELLSRGYEVKAFLQEGRETGTLDGLDIEKFYGDITDYRSIESGLNESDGVIHCAASTQIWPGRSPAIWKVNYDAVALLIEAVLAKGLKKLVHIGTANSFGPGSLDSPGTEENPYTDHIYRLDYQDSKQKAQELLLIAWEKRGLPVSIINPTFMLGAFDSKPGAGAMLLALSEGKSPGASPGGKNYVAASAVARAAVTALEKGRNGHCYICGGENLSYRQAFDRFSSVLGVTTPRFDFPAWLVLLSGTLGSLWASISGKAPTISRAMARIANADCYYSSRKAMTELDLPQLSIDEAASECFAWMRERGYTGEVKK